MNKDFAKIPENAESKAVDREKEEYPVQQVAVTYPIGEKEVKDLANKKILCLPIGMGCLDVALAYVAYERAKEQHIGFDFDFSGESYTTDMPEKMIQPLD